jgi:dTDP-4-dehydro-6-deoxy-alpha-D-glucopyranose 2,3-dehydratase
MRRHLRAGPAPDIAARLAESVARGPDRAGTVARCRAWLDDVGRWSRLTVEPADLAELAGWVDEGSAIRHASGKFFSVEGIEVSRPGAPVDRWRQPILNQPEVGVLGLLVRFVDGVLHVLLQAKVEPGNAGGLQLSPTVQATRSNYTRVHGGRPVPYLEFFRDPDRHRVLADVRQSEQGSWFLRKTNRNVILEVTDDVPVLDGFRWFALAEVYQLLAEDDLVNMDTRTVLSCLPFAGPGVPAGGDGLAGALLRSFDPAARPLNDTAAVLSMITDMRVLADGGTRGLPLTELAGWHRVDGRITHRSGAFFDVIGVRVEAGGREVGAWSQPMVAAVADGLVAFVVTRIDGVLHALAQLREEPGFVDVVELAPTVQCTPVNYDHLPAAARPPYLDAVLAADPADVHVDVLLSEEGGRFYRTRNRYLVVESDAVEARPGYAWLTLAQMADLLRHSQYLNVQARTLVACLYGLSGDARALAVR